MGKAKTKKKGGKKKTTSGDVGGGGPSNPIRRWIKAFLEHGGQLLDFEKKPLTYEDLKGLRFSGFAHNMAKKLANHPDFDIPIDFEISLPLNDVIHFRSSDSLKIDTWKIVFVAHGGTIVEV